MSQYCTCFYQRRSIVDHDLLAHIAHNSQIRELLKIEGNEEVEKLREVLFKCWFTLIATS
jgi:hypothetical protein